MTNARETTRDLIADQVLERSRFRSAEDVRKLASLANAERQFGREYHGRFVIELLQNAADAWRKVAKPNERSRVRIILGEGPSLILANQGEVLSAETIIRSLGHIGASTKPHGEAIGHKGIGFKSVLEMTLAMGTVWAQWEGVAGLRSHPAAEDEALGIGSLLAKPPVGLEGHEEVRMKHWAVVGTVALVMIPAAVVVASPSRGREPGGVDTQTIVWRNGSATVSAEPRWLNVPSLGPTTICAQGPLSVILGVGSGFPYPVWRISIDDVRALSPGARGPTGESTMHFVGQVSDGTHVVTPQWRYWDGNPRPISFSNGSLTLLYQQGTDCG